jgi:hypothetical protein
LVKKYKIINLFINNYNLNQKKLLNNFKNKLTLIKNFNNIIFISKKKINNLPIFLLNFNNNSHNLNNNSILNFNNNLPLLKNVNKLYNNKI